MFGGPLITGTKGFLDARKAKKEQEKLRKQAKAANEAWYARNYYQDQLNTIEGQSALKKVREATDERLKEARAREIISGGTGSEVASVHEAGAQALANTASNLAEQGGAIKRSVDAQKLSLDADVREQEMAVQKAKQASGEAAVANAANAIKEAAMAAATGGASLAVSGAANAAAGAGGAANGGSAFDFLKNSGMV